MAIEEYYCYSCERAEYFNSKSTTHTCPQCYREMSSRFKMHDAKFTYDEEKKELVIRSGVKTMGFGEFKNAKSVESVVLPDSLIEIPDGCFENATKLEKVTIV